MVSLAVIRRLDSLAADARHYLRLGDALRADTILNQRLSIIKPIQWVDGPNAPPWLQYMGTRTTVTRAEAKAINWVYQHYIVDETPKRSIRIPREHTYALKNLKRRLTKLGVDSDMLPFDNEDFVGLLYLHGTLTPYPPVA